MSVPVIAFFNNKGGVGKTTLVYHLSWAYADLGKKVLVVDLDPQANLTSSFRDDDQLEALWTSESPGKTVYGSVEPLLSGTGDILDKPYTIDIDSSNGEIHLLPGDLDLSRFEDELSQQWPKCLDRQVRAFRVISAFWRLMQNGAKEVDAEIILVDLGPNLGAINRSALIAADYLVIPLTPDLYSLQGLRNIGPTIRVWRNDWQERLSKNPDTSLKLPEDGIDPIGYIVMQHSVREDRPVKAYDRWVKRIPGLYEKEFPSKNVISTGINDGRDPNCIGLVKHYRSLIPMSMEAHKPMFHLLPADGAIGSHYHVVQEAGKNFKQLALEIEKRYKEKAKK